MSKSPKRWDPEKWVNRCSWCAKKISAEAPAFGISVRLHNAAFSEMDPGSIQPLFLAGSGKTVPMMVVAANSPAKRAGKDAMFQACSESCAQSLQAALQLELSDAS